MLTVTEALLADLGERIDCLKRDLAGAAQIVESLLAQADRPNQTEEYKVHLTAALRSVSWVPPYLLRAIRAAEKKQFANRAEPQAESA